MPALKRIKWTLARRFFAMTALSVLGLALVTLSMLYVVGKQEADASGKRLSAVLQQLYDDDLRHQVQIVHSQLGVLLDQRDKGKISPAEAEELAREMIRGARYGSSGYFWADTYEGVNVVLLGKQIEGLHRWDAQDSDGLHYIQELLRAGTQPGGGFVNYRFPRPGSALPLLKRSYALAFEPYSWVIGTGYYLEDIELKAAERVEVTRQMVASIQWQFIVMLSFGLLVLIAVSGFIGGRLSRPLDELRASFEQLAREEPSLGVQLEVRSQDDIGALIQAFNSFMSRYTLVFRHKHAYQVLTEKLAILAEAHDGDTSAHTLRVGMVSGILARGLGLPEDRSVAIAHAARLHDVGKLFIDPRLINKGGKISPEERDLLQKHTTLAQKLLEDEAFALERTIAVYHHERMDGSGYPQGLRGDAIPLEAQIVGVADVFDALRSARSYKPALDAALALKCMREGDERMAAGSFNPAILEVLEQSLDEIEALVYGAGQEAVAP